MIIVDCRVYRFRLPLVRPLQLKGESYVCRDGLVLKLTADNGAVGYGEISPLPGFSKETFEFALSRTKELARKIRGRVVPELDELLSVGLQELFGQETNPASVRFGFEAAMLNLIAANNNKAIANLLSKSPRRSVPVNALLSGAPDDVIDRAASLKDQGFSAFKLKVGRLPVSHEIELVCRLREVTGREALLRLDANRAWSSDDAELFWKGVASCGIDYVEEPVSSLRLLLEFAQGSNMPIALDESLAEMSPGDLPMNDNFKAVVLKPTMLGLISSLQTAKEATERGMQAIVSSSFESDLGVTILAQVAAALNKDDVPAGLDTLDWFERRLMVKPPTIERGRLDILSAPILFDDLDYSMLEEVTSDNSLHPHVVSSAPFKDQPAIISNGATVSYADYYRMIAASASSLKAHGVTPGSKVGVLLNSCPQYPVLVMAIIQAGGVACPLNPNLPTSQLGRMLKQINCRMTITVDRSIGCGTHNDVQLLRPSDILESVPAELPRGADSIYAFDREATVVFTSGTSGDPVAVVHTLGNHYYSALGSARNIPFGPGDRWLLSLPLYHVGGLAIFFRAIFCGGAVVVPNQDEKIVDMVTRFGVTHLSLVSTQLYRLLKEPSLADAARSLKAILVGGSATPDSLLSEALRCGLPLHTTYGLSEMSSQVTTTRKGQLNREETTSGRLLDYRQMKISGDGEILVKGETLFKGYRKGDSVSLPVDPVDDEGWFSTGDLGRFDAECNLKVLGRKDNMFISGGENIHPEQIESALVGFEDVEKAIVVGVEDDEFGQRPAAFVAMRPGYEYLPAAQWKKRLRPTLPGFMMPMVFLDWPESEAGTGLKPSRHRFTQLAANLLNRSTTTWGDYHK